MAKTNFKIYLIFFSIFFIGLMYLSAQNALAACGWWCTSSQLSGNFCTDHDATSYVGKISCLNPPSSCNMCPDPNLGGGGSCPDYSGVSDVGCYCDGSYSCDVDCGGNTCSCDPECFGPPPPPPTAIPPTPTPIPPDFVVSSLEARNSNGEAETYFKVGQRVYPRVVVRNQGTHNALKNYTTRVYLDEDQTKYTSITMNNPFTAGSSRTFEPWTDGTNANKFTSPKTFLMTEAGRFHLLARVNYNNAGPETSYSNNAMTVGYNVRALFQAYVCNDKNENGQCKNTGDRSKQNISISLDENVTSAPGFETHIKSVATAADGIANFSYRMDGHYKMSLADVDANNNWKLIGAKTNSDAWRAGSTSCTLTVGSNFTCELAAIPLHTLSGTIFIDDNRNGTKDIDETSGLNNATVTLDGPTGKTTTTNTSGNYSFTRLRAGAYTLSLTVPTGYVAYPSSSITVSPAITIGQDNPATFTENIGVNEICSLTGRVYASYDKIGDYNSSEDFPVAGVRVFTAGQMEKEATTGSDGRYSIGGLTNGNYTLNIETPSGYTNLDTLPRLFTVTDCASVPAQNIKVYGAYTVSGNAFLDTNGDKLKATNGAELNIAASPNVSIQDLAGRPKAFPVNNNDGTYTMENLINANYTVRYGGLPNGFYMVWPLTGAPPSYSVTVGSSCAPYSPAPGGTCNGTNIESLDFAVDAGRSWLQTYGLDIRFDGGINNPVPSTPNAACGGANTLVNGSGTTPGVAFSGNLTADFHSGGASSTNWVVGSTNYNEIFKAHNSAGTETSYDYFQSVMKQSNITPINLTTICPDLNSCTLPGNLANGIYQANGNVTLVNTSTLPANKDYVILINGTLTIGGTVDVPDTSTATFSVADDITVAPTLGRVAACPAPANADIDGFFSTDKSFIIPSNSDCATDTPDLQLNVQGSIAVNANRANSGQFVNERTLCDGGNLNFPSFTIKDRPDMILNAPDFLRVPTYIWKEIAPN